MSKTELYLDQLKASHPSIGPKVDILADLYSKKLWHQLSQAVEDFISTVPFQGQGSLVSFYDGFINDFATRMNRLHLATIAVRVSENYSDLAQSRTFCEKVIDIVKDEPQAVIYIRARISFILMDQGNFKEAKLLIRELKETLDEMPRAEPIVHSIVTKVAMHYHRIQGTPSEFYKNALAFLNYTPQEKISKEECESVVFQLALAACISQDVYNFGELLSLPSVRTLVDSPHNWLYQLIVAFNTGSIEHYAKLTVEFAPQMNEQPALLNSKLVMEQKIMLCALIELLFHRPPSERQLSFESISQAVKCPVDHVELLLMKAMSLNLIRGVIDQVDEIVDVSWVKPRVLQNEQIKTLSDRLGDWAKTVEETSKFVEKSTQEIVV